MKIDDLKKKIDTRNFKVSVVGLGYIGQVISSVLSEQNIDVLGIETNQKTIDSINNGQSTVHEPNLSEMISNAVTNKHLHVYDDFSKVSQSDVIIVTVNTPIDSDFKSNLDNLLAAVTSLSKYIVKNQIIILKSTVPPKTTLEKVLPILESNSNLKAGIDFYLGFSPERLAEGKAIEEFKKFPIVVGGVNSISSELISYFWKSILNVKTIIVKSPTEAEMVKLADNLWIDLNIALANELAMLSEKMNIDVLEVIAGANTLPKGQHNVNILFPSVGVGGSCLTKDPWFLHEIGKNYDLDLKIPVLSRTINNNMPYYTVHLLEKNLQSQNKDLNKSKIAILGLSFKNNTGDLRETPTKYVIEKLSNSNCILSIFDPLVNPSECLEYFGINMESSIDDTIKNADCIMVLCGHDQFLEYPKHKFSELTNNNCIFLDGRNVFSRTEIQNIGLVYQGIGK